MLHSANPKTRANRHSIKIEDALMLDEELDHEDRFSLPVSRSFSAKEAVAFQEASEPQPWQDISQILHTHIPFPGKSQIKTCVLVSHNLQLVSTHFLRNRKTCFPD